MVAVTDRPALSAQIGLVAACLNPRLLGFPLYPEQRRILGLVERHRLTVLACGRRSGKTTLAALTALHGCLFEPELDALVRPGETRFALVVATESKQARVLVRLARAIVEASPVLRGLLDGPGMDDELRFRLPSGARTALRSFPCSSRSIRGYAASHVIFDELAFFMSEVDGPQEAARVWSAVLPSAAQFGERARILALSTPFGTDGLFSELFTKAQTGEIEDAVAIQLPTWKVNASITEASLQIEKSRDPDGFGAEFGAEFKGSGGAFLDMDRVMVADRGELPPEACTGWVCGLDPAFSSDPFGAALVGREPG